MSQIPEDEVEPKFMFDEKLNQKFRTAAHAAFLEVPELRSVVVVYDYYRNLNDMPDVSKGLWLSAEGGKEKPTDAIAGSLGSLLQSAAHILEDMFQRHQTMLTQLTEISKQILEKKNELSKLQ